MPVIHDLYQDLKVSRDEVQKISSKDRLLNSLIEKYSQADAEVVKAEEAKSSDDEVRKLKEARLLVKDKIVKQLETHS
ncbi:hypothetical protein PS645_01035 [Pseudomonas fluorescens]|uniref:DUF465 domain-containing protein n=1 Tax=Pseudomonas fluorescens TaxID=294 RepID=A0A5E6QMM5_PSEFL|nr:DUF465 domain-containing protein [Pseudomonas fluorescens]VVM56548.1 hypothetical protein PS645_01035 [Pseudomonas fluorescens]